MRGLHTVYACLHTHVVKMAYVEFDELVRVAGGTPGDLELT